MTINGERSNAWRRRLYLPAYTIAEAARYADSPPSTISSWFNRDSSFGPALAGREKATPLSYLQLVEVAFVVTARKLGISLGEIRTTRNFYRQRFNTEYPFATYRFQTEGLYLLLDLQQIMPSEERGKFIIGSRSGQLAWADLMGKRFLEFEYLGDLAIIWYVAGRDSPVRIDPRVNFGAPTVRGIPTWAIKGRREAGEGIDEIQEDFNLEHSEVVAALNFEGTPLVPA
jgi:uncharacterized protein (DUF433 family)